MSNLEGEGVKPEKVKDKPKKDKKKKESRTVETMYRTTLTNHLRLSNMADQKAGLLVSVNTLIISIMTSLMIHEIGLNPYLIIPTVCLIVVCLLTITFALMATRPSVKPMAENMDLSHVNDMDLLFFADYTALSVEEYKIAIKQLVSSDERLHDSLIKNIYAQGKVMQKKYALLKKAYTVFMYGFPLAILVYLLVLSRSF